KSLTCGWSTMVRFHFEIYVVAAWAQLESEPLIQTDGGVRPQYAQRQRYLRCPRFFDEARNQMSADPATAMFRQQSDIHQPQFLGGAIRDHRARGRRPAQDDGLRSLGKGRGVRASARLELHAREGVLLRGIPAPGIHLILPRAPVDACQEFEIGGES